MKSIISFYINDEITSATLINQDGGSDGVIQTTLVGFTGGYVKFEISEPARYTLVIDGVNHDGCVNRHLPSNVDIATVDNLVSFTANGNIQDSGVAVSTDGAFTANSDSKVVSEKAIKTYVDKFESVTNGEGASLIGVEDTAGNFTSGNVEGVLAEIMTDLRNLLYSGFSTETPTVTVSETNNTLTIECSPIENSGVAIIGNYRFRIVYDSSGATDPTVSDTIIVSQSNAITVQKPDTGYDGENHQYINVDCRFEGLGGNSNYSSVGSVQFDEPNLVTDEGIIASIATGSDNARTVAKMIANLISDNTVVGRMIANERGDFITSDGPPSQAEYKGQWCLDETNHNWYRAVSANGTNDGDAGSGDFVLMN